MRIQIILILLTLVLFAAMMLSLAFSDTTNYLIVAAFAVVSLFTMWHLIRSEITRGDKEL